MRSKCNLNVEQHSMVDGSVLGENVKKTIKENVSWLLIAAKIALIACHFEN